MADYYFATPTVLEAPFAWEIPLSRYRMDRGVSVVEYAAGQYQLARFIPYTYQNELLDAGLQFFQGGYQHVVDDATRTALIDAAIGITETNFTPV